MKYYMKEGGCCTWGLEDLKEEMVIDGIKEMKLLGMKRDIGGEMWCSGVEVEVGECGRHCDSYLPRNGKNGRCRSLENGFTADGSKYLLTKNGLTKLT